MICWRPTSGVTFSETKYGEKVEPSPRPPKNIARLVAIHLFYGLNQFDEN